MKITREELYRRVWETPVRTLAKEFDISDVGLAKACRKHQIPIPHVGYWTKVQFGKVVTKPPLPHNASVDVLLEAGRFRPPAVPASVDAQKPPGLQILLPATTDGLAPIAAATFKCLLKATPDLSGMVSCRGDNVFNCEVAPETVERAVRILHAIELALPVVGARLVKESKETCLQVERDGRSVAFRVHEQYTRSEFVIKDKQHSWMDRREFTYQPTGKLTFQILGYFSGRKNWSDGVRDCLDTKLLQVVTGLLGAIESIKNREHELELQRLRWAETAKVREELERKRRAEDDFRRQLMAEVKIWSECKAGFAYLTQVRGQLLKMTARLPEAASEWLSHTEQALTEMNPIAKRIEMLTKTVDSEK